ncbi:MAG TPA: hypothetical protein VFX20_18225 [Steroidobacteraceae bacterium]|nr:hypothetical protein [Steroidobacteraceae bacterium]
MTSKPPQLIAAHYIALLLLSTCERGSKEHQEIIEMNGPGVWLALAELHLVQRFPKLWTLTERGQVLVDHILVLPMPVNAWRMPNLHSTSAVSETEPPLTATAQALHNADTILGVGTATAEDEGEPPPRPPAPKPIQGIVPAADPAARLKQAEQLLERGYGVSEIAETLEMSADEIERAFFA